jgi:hypothetical protein
MAAPAVDTSTDVTDREARRLRGAQRDAPFVRFAQNRLLAVLA